MTSIQVRLIAANQPESRDVLGDQVLVGSEYTFPTLADGEVWCIVEAIYVQQAGPAQGAAIAAVTTINCDGMHNPIAYVPCRILRLRQIRQPRD